jgi:hypothetical protein
MAMLRVLKTNARARGSLAALLTGSVLSGCGGSDSGGSSTPPRLLDVGGDGQTVTQHIATNVPLEVQAVDAHGQAVPGVAVSFAPGASSSGFSPAVVTSDALGDASFKTYFHVAGDQVVNATAPGYTPVAFTLHIAPEGIPIDGAYAITYEGMSYQGRPVPDGATPMPVLFGLANGSVEDFFYAIDLGGLCRPCISGGSFDQGTGSFSVTYVLSLDYERTFDGSLSLDPDAPGGSGSWVDVFDGYQDVAGSGGTWTAQRL